MTQVSSLTHAISINPANGEQIGHYPFESASILYSALSRAATGFSIWRSKPVTERSQSLIALAHVLRDGSETMAKMITLEMGKPTTQARGEIEKCAQLCEWYAEHGPSMLNAEPTQVEGGKARIEYRPLGPILAVMPWNFPIWQVLRGAVPALVAGNTYLLKHAPNVMGCAYMLRDAFKHAGFADGHAIEGAHINAYLMP